MSRSGIVAACTGVLVAVVVAGTGVASADTSPGCAYPDVNNPTCQTFGHDSTSPSMGGPTHDHNGGRY
ncbi:hypothetical protein ACFXHA_29285 [Nocardia sp. NPDC059240]|uniref:hypothetical protein n=1 Tax=Nocardia sp. NPDC059240 TaxID=3346786 RepID=UPI0036AD5835